jgi:MFS family permease
MNTEVGHIGSVPEGTTVNSPGLGDVLAVPARLLNRGNLWWLWAGQLVSQLGEGVNKLALLWFVYELTGSAIKATMIGILETIPPLVFGPIVGVCLDRLSAHAKIRLMIWLDVARAVLLVTLPTLYVMGILTLPALYAVVFGYGVVSVPFGPALNAAIPRLVHASRLTAANAAMQSAMTIGLLCGPAISGAGIALFGMEYVLYANALTFLVAALCKVPIDAERESPGVESASMWSGWTADLRAGLRFVCVEQRVLFHVTAFAAVCNLVSSGFIFLLPIIAKDVLHGGPVMLGLIWPALGLGMMIMSLILMSQTRHQLSKHIWLISTIPVLQGLAIAVLGWANGPVTAVSLIFIVGTGIALIVPIVTAFIQEIVPNGSLAKVSTIFGTMNMATAMLGMTTFSWLADQLGAVTTLTMLGGLQILVALAGIMFVFARSVATTPMVAAEACPALPPAAWRIS